MARKKEKELIHKPDMLVTVFESVSLYIRENTKQCLYGLAALLIIVAAVAAYIVYSNHQAGKVQYQLTLGITAWETYEQTRAAGEMDKAEGIFQKIASGASGKPRYISKLYLANINLARGKQDEALKLYQDVSKNSSSKTLTYLADRAIKSLEKK
ncbi:MAG: hypothetical protein A4E61_01769 [Syntrophorhabdus sp. PtaB.Bin184]|jgi:predicted negative regulator of RcsB-dependent stress response|nr:MAG: hypothetical protein A4E61_01769 [Syntrophorhabdus sp. PtaB.Bin184]